MATKKSENDDASPVVVEISQALIGAVAEKLEKATAKFSDDEKAAIQTAFALAAKGLGTFTGPASCVGDLRIGIGEKAITVERKAGSDVPKMSEAFADAFCPGKLSRYDIDGLEVDKSSVGGGGLTTGSKSAVAAARPGGALGAKSAVAARPGGALGAKSAVAAAKTICRSAKPVPARAINLNPGYRIRRCAACRTSRCIPSFAINLNRCFAIRRCAPA